MEDIEGLIFDYGGTLDSHGDHWSHVFRRAYRAEGLDIDDNSFRAAYIHGERHITPLVKPSDTMMDLLLTKTGLQARYLGLDPALSLSIAGRCYEEARRYTAEAAETLGRLSGRYAMVVVSNFYGNLRSVMRDFGLLGFFRGIIDSAEAGVRKPDPAIFRLGLDCLSLPASKVLAIGDSVGKDIIPASSIGCRTALLRGLPWDEAGAGTIPPDTVSLTSIMELPGLLEG